MNLKSTHVAPFYTPKKIESVKSLCNLLRLTQHKCGHHLEQPQPKKICENQSNLWTNQASAQKIICENLRNLWTPICAITTKKINTFVEHLNTIEMKVLMVCLGNICRSPMADGLLRKKVKEEGLSVEVDSAGTGDWHVGQAPDDRMRETGKQFGVSIDDLRGRQFETSDFDRFDRIYVMDQSNYKNVVALARNNDDRDKVELILNVSQPGKDLEVPDPYFGGDEGFKNVFKMLDEATDIIIDEIKTINGKS